MKKYPFCLAFLLFLASAGSPLKTGIESEQNRIDMLQLKEGMEQKEILSLLGSPDKEEKKGDFEVWYYITSPTRLGQSKLIDKNYTPLIFREKKLIGWGKGFYRYHFDIDGEKERQKEELRQKYTDDADEWPPQKSHTIVPPIKEEPTS